RPSPTCAYDDDRLRLPPASPARNSKAGKKESMGRRLNQLCPPYATPSSNSSLDYRRSDARIVENGFAKTGGVGKSAKVVLAAPSRISRASKRPSPKLSRVSGVLIASSTHASHNRAPSPSLVALTLHASHYRAHRNGNGACARTRSL